MTFLAIITALLLGLAVPPRWLETAALRASELLEGLGTALDDGTPSSGGLALVAALGIVLVPLAVLHKLSIAVGFGLPWFLDVLLLLLTLRFWSVVRGLTTQTLQMRKRDPSWVAADDAMTHAHAEQALTGSLAFVFAPIIAYLIIPGPYGPALVGTVLALQQGYSHKRSAFVRPLQLAAGLVLWPIERIAAASFAVVGDFESALGAWRATPLGDATSKGGAIFSGVVRASLGLPGIVPIESDDDTWPVDNAWGSAQGLADLELGVWRALAVWLGIALLIAVARLG